MTFIAIASCLELELTADGSFRALLQVGWPTAGVVAVFWLPTALRLIGLAGGKFKKGNMEASTEGLLERLSEDAVSPLTELRTAADRLNTDLFDRPRDVVADLNEQIDRVSELLRPRAISEETIARLARSYEQLRVEMEPGDPRTIAMTEIVNEARVRASSDRGVAGALALNLVKDASEGRRMVGLAFLQEEPDPRAIDDVLKGIVDSRSAFEAFHALNVLKNMAPRLTTVSKRAALEALEQEKKDPRRIGVMEDPNLPSLIEWVISVLR
jgi:hypothetical protein